MKKLIFIFLLLCNTIFWSQNINISSIDFEHENEKLFFEKISKTEQFNLKDIFSNNPKDVITSKTIIDIINDTQDQLNSKNINNKSIKKQLKEINKLLNKNFFIAFDINSSLNQLFNKKQFNATTATYFYAIILDYYNIPYTINLNETNFPFIVVHDDFKTVLKPKNLPNGSITYDNTFKENYINYLTQNNMISVEEKTNTNLNQLFITHYLSERIISKTSLISILYHEKANHLININDYEKALTAAKKSTFLNSNNQNSYLYYSLITQCINDNANNKKYDGKLIGEFLNISQKNATERKQISNLVLIVANEYLVETQNIEKFNSFFDDFKSVVNDDVEFDDFQNTYHEALANFHYLNTDYQQAINHLSESLIIKPNNLRVKNNIENCFNNIMFVITDSEESIEKQNLYFEKFPFLKEKKLNQLNYTGSYLKAIYQAYIAKEFEKGYQRILDFENLTTTSPELKFDQNYVDSAFLTAANSYEARDSNKIISVLEIGLKIAPRSNALLERYNLIKKYKNYRNQMAIERNKAAIPEKTFSEKINNYLKKCWTVTTMEKIGKDTEKNDDLEFTIELSGYKKLSYHSTKKSFKGDYSVRSQSKLLYLIPKNNRSKYFVYKIMEIDENKLKLRPFINEKLTNRVLTLTPCKNNN